KGLYESPLSEYLSGDFNVIAVHGKVSDVNVYFEIWIPQIQENEEETAYNIIKSSTYMIYRNGRFWVRFDLASKVNRFKLVVINNGVIDEEFRVSIYEVQLAKIVKKKQEAFLLINDSLFLNDPLPFKLIRRSQWQAKDPTSSYISHTPKKIT
ncbi:MAG: hypothetical protein N2Z60_09810, partial [Elusimicrobiales bacterium]|nr:hypothetical protein [Elusimicrobiales bacterium]